MHPEKAKNRIVAEYTKNRQISRLLIITKNAGVIEINKNIK
jgi:hypothetical protein